MPEAQPDYQTTNLEVFALCLPVPVLVPPELALCLPISDLLAQLFSLMMLASWLQALRRNSAEQGFA